MKVKQTVKRLILATLVVVGIGVSIAPSALADCGGVTTSVVNCSTSDATCPDGTRIATDKVDSTPCPDGSKAKLGVTNTGIWAVLLLVINILTAGIGVVAVGGIVYASIIYTTAGGDANQTKKAMTIIADIVIGVVAYALMYAVLNFLVPGGLFNN